MTESQTGRGALFAGGLAAFLQLSHGFMTKGKNVGIPQGVAATDELVARVSRDTLNLMYGLYPSAQIPSQQVYRQNPLVWLKQNALAFRMRNVVPGARYRLTYEHFLGGQPVSAPDYVQWYNVSVVLASGRQMASQAIAWQQVAITHNPVDGWVKAPDLQFDVPFVNTWSSGAAGDSLDVNEIGRASCRERVSSPV